MIWGGGDMGVRRCLARFLTSLAPMRTPKSANGPRSNSFRPDSPSRPTSNRGTKDSAKTSPHRTWSVPDASSNPKNIHRNGSLEGIPAFLGYFLLRGAVFLIFTRLLSSAFGKVNVIISSISPLSFFTAPLPFASSSSSLPDL